MVGLTTAEKGTDGAEATATPASTSIEVGAGQAVVLPEGFALTDATFGRVGSNLVMTTEDGAQVVVRGYFAVETPPALVSANGMQLSGDAAVRLAGDPAHGASAQAGVAGVGEPVGTVDQVVGEVVITRADGSKVQPQNGDPLFRGDVIETGKDAAIGVVLADQTSIGVGDDARLMIDDLVYDPGAQQGSLQLSFLKGVATFVSGEIAKTAPDAMVVETPAATLGIRGTQVNVKVDDKGVLVVLDKEADESVGEVTISNDNGIQTINTAYGVVFVQGGEAPDVAGTWTIEQVQQAFGDSLISLPLIGTANDHGMKDVSVAPAAAPPPTETAEVSPTTLAAFTKPLGDEVTGDIAVPVALAAVDVLEDGEAVGGSLSESDRQTITETAVVVTPPTEVLPPPPPPVDDTINGTPNDDVFAFVGEETVSRNGEEISLAGITRIDGLAGADTVAFGDGDDVFDSPAAFPVALTSIEILNTGGGADEVALAVLPAGVQVIDGGDGTDTVTFGDSDDAITSSAAFPVALRNVEILNTGDGDDTVALAALPIGVQEIDGGDGTDTVTFGDGDDAITSSAAFPVALTSIEILNTGGGDDVVDLSVLPQGISTIDLGDGNDEIPAGGDLSVAIVGASTGFTIDGGAGNDIITAGAGNDVISGGFGADVVDGGAGDDVLMFGPDSEGFTWSAAYRAFDAGSGPGKPGSGEMVSVGGRLRSSDVFDGGEGNDTLLGTAGNDAIFLDDSINPNGAKPRMVGIETIKAGDGNDVVDLTSSRFTYGNVTIYGGDGDDVLWASAGNDVVIGGAGNDMLRGGAGDDTFVFSSGDGSDTIFDFGLGDTIVLKGFSEGDISRSKNGDDWQFETVSAGGDVDVHITVKNAEQFGGYSITSTGSGDDAVTTITHATAAA